MTQHMIKDPVEAGFTIKNAPRLASVALMGFSLLLLPAVGEAQRGERGGKRGGGVERSQPSRDSARSSDRQGEKSRESSAGLEEKSREGESKDREVRGEVETVASRETSSESAGRFSSREERSRSEKTAGETGQASSREATSRGERSIEKSSSAEARGSQLSPAQQSQVQELKGELTSLAQGGVAAEDEIRELASDLQDMAIQPPDPALTQALASDLQSALADSTLSPVEMAQLSQSVYAVLNSAGLDAQEVQVLIDDVEAILQAADVSRSDIEAIVSSLESVAGSVGGASLQSAPESKSSGRFSSRRRGGSR